MEKLYPPKIKHSLEYYHSVLEVLADSLPKGLRYPEIADTLNLKGIMSASGKPWSQSTVQQTVYRFRNCEISSSHLYSAMLQLCFDGKFSKERAMLILGSKRQTM